MEFTEDEVRTAVQKHAAANKRLMEASESLKRAQELEKRLTGQLPASPQLESDRPGDSSPRPRPVIPATRQVTPELRTRVRDLTRALQFGDEQEAEEKLLQFALDTGPAAFNEEQLLTKTVTRAEEERTKKEIRAAFEAPPEEGGYGDIAADPVLYQAIALEIQNAVTPTDQGGLGMDPFDWGTYKQYGEKFRRDYLSHRVDSKNLEDKKQQKRQLETLPQANVAPTPGVGEAPPDDPNPSATIAEMARARGQNI
jgi:hypothetical protein